MSEILDAPAQATTSDLTASLTAVQGHVAEFDKIAAGLAALALAHPVDVVCDVTTPAGMKQAIAGRAAWRDPRIAVEKARKAAKAPVLELGRKIDAFAAEVTEKLLIGEANYDDQIKAEERRKEAERQAKIEAEMKRVADLQERVDFLRQFATSCVGLSADKIWATLQTLEVEVIDDTYQELKTQAEGVKAESLAKMRELHTKAIEAEAEQARIAAERAELERLRQEAAERDRLERERVEAEQRAEAQRLAEQRAAFEREQAAARAEQERKDREAAEARARADEEAARHRAEADRLAREAREAEQRRLDEQAAELRRQQEAAAAERRQREEAEAAERRAKQEAEDRARARVQQAAPRLLAALQGLVSVVRAMETDGIDGEAHATALAEADAAIADAT